MTDFKDILTGTPEKLAEIFSAPDQVNTEPPNETRLVWWSRRLQLKPEQLICAVGFNPRVQELADIFVLLGHTKPALIKLRNEIFSQDIYKKLPLDNVLTIYGVVKESPETMQVMQYLLGNRIAHIESKIEATVNSTIIEKYKAEVRTIYMAGIASIDFAEDRLSRTGSGFRALLNEVVIITESRVIPAGDIFFRNSVLPEEKRKLLSRGLIPMDLVETRLEDKSISFTEKKMLQDYLDANKQ